MKKMKLAYGDKMIEKLYKNPHLLPWEQIAKKQKHVKNRYDSV